jgi:hypothetical protein
VFCSFSLNLRLKIKLSQFARTRYDSKTVKDPGPGSMASRLPKTSRALYTIHLKPIDKADEITPHTRQHARIFEMAFSVPHDFNQTGNADPLGTSSLDFQWGFILSYKVLLRQLVVESTTNFRKTLDISNYYTVKTKNSRI